MNHKEFLSEEELDFLHEMMNIGAGNAVTALSQLLKCKMNMIIPAVYILPIPQVASIFGDSSLPTVCVRMGMVGDVSGELFFVVPDEDKLRLARLVERATQRAKKEDSEVDLSVLTEVGNIVAGVYLTAIHDFCQLSIYHTVPTPAIDMIQSVLDESLIALSRQVQTSLVIENEFIVEGHHIRTFLLMVPSVESVKTLVDSMGEARIGCSSK